MHRTSCLPPEHASDRGVSLVRSDCASISPPLSNRISTTPTCPAVAARMRGVKPVKREEAWLQTHTTQDTATRKSKQIFFNISVDGFECKAYTPGAAAVPFLSNMRIRHQSQCLHGKSTHLMQKTHTLFMSATIHKMSNRIVSISLQRTLFVPVFNVGTAGY